MVEWRERRCSRSIGLIDGWARCSAHRQLAGEGIRKVPLYYFRGLGRAEEGRKKARITYTAKERVFTRFINTSYLV